MKLKAVFAAMPLLALAALAFAQVAAPVIVASTPATTEAVQNSAWWNSIANEAITALAGVATAAVATLAPFVVQWVRNRSKVAAMFVTQAMVDRMVAGVQNIIRAQASELEQKLGTAPETPLTAEQKKVVAAKAQPKVEAAFKETLARIGKTPGSQEVKDLILGHVDAALAKPAAIVPGVVARSG